MAGTIGKGARPAGRAPSSLEEWLAAVTRARRTEEGSEALGILRSVLACRFPAAVARAAKAAGERELAVLAPELAEAFHRHLKSPEKSDKGCLAKTEIVDALQRLGVRDEALFRTALRVRQLEAAAGRPVDTAARMRGLAALGLVRIGSASAVVESADLIADAEPETRLLAVRALGAAGHPSALPALRVKLALGDPEPAVTTECVAAMMELDAEGSAQAVRRRLDAADGEEVEAILQGLGSVRGSESLHLLEQFCQDGGDASARAVALSAVVSMRTDAAVDLLLRWLREAPGTLAREVLHAMEAMRGDGAAVARIRQAVGQREDGALDTAIARMFGAL